LGKAAELIHPPDKPAGVPRRHVIRVRRATAADADALAPLFDAYRLFYRQPSSPRRAKSFLLQRLRRGESVVFLAEQKSGSAWKAVGFTQLYPIFSSIRCTRTWVLYDLFIVPPARRLHIARRLMAAARRHAKRTGADGIELSTARTNRKAQRLYEACGYARDREFLHYELRL
jgi:ribosomal protein S18 acetylase RimI-like enzyme